MANDTIIKSIRDIFDMESSNSFCFTPFETALAVDETLPRGFVSLELFRNSPQYLHLTASAFISSVQKGHFTIFIFYNLQFGRLMLLHPHNNKSDNMCYTTHFLCKECRTHHLHRVLYIHLI